MLATLNKVVTAVKFAYEVVTTVKDLVQEVEKEDLDDGVKYGEKKKSLVMDLTLSVYDVADDAVGELPVSKETVKDLVDTAIEAFVQFFNAVGKFRSLSTGKDKEKDKKEN